MQYSRWMKGLYITLVAVVISACGGSGNGEGDGPTAGSVQNQLIDSPLAGVDYYCDDKAVQKTTSIGKFTCQHVPITFKIGKLLLGTIYRFTFDGKIFPQDLVGVSRNNFTDEKLIELVRLLQSMDEDGNISVAIEIPSDMASKFDDETINDKDLDAKAAEAGVSLVDEDTAIAHLTNSMINVKKDIGQFGLDRMHLWMTGCWYKHGESRDSYAVTAIQMEFQEGKVQMMGKGGYIFPYEFYDNESFKFSTPDGVIKLDATGLGLEYYQDSLSEHKDIISFWANKEEAESYRDKVGDGAGQHRTCTIGAIGLRPLPQ